MVEHPFTEQINDLKISRWKQLNYEAHLFWDASSVTKGVECIPIKKSPKNCFLDDFFN